MQTGDNFRTLNILFSYGVLILRRFGQLIFYALKSFERGQKKDRAKTFWSVHEAHKVSVILKALDGDIALVSKVLNFNSSNMRKTIIDVRRMFKFVRLHVK